MENMNTKTAKTVIVGLGEYAVIDDHSVTLKAIGLGSCVAVTMFVPSISLTAMAHIVLPSKKLYENENITRAITYYADSGINFLVQELNRKGCKYNHEIVVKLAGGANIINSISNEIGHKNVLAVKKALWRFRLGPIAEDLNGNFNRTVEVISSNQALIITTPNGKKII
jgi:chemotaxis protein CheD